MNWLFVRTAGFKPNARVENYPISGYRGHPRHIRAMGRIKKAVAAANSELRLIDEKVAKAVQRAAEEEIKGRWNGEFVADVYEATAGVSFHMNANELIASRAIELLVGKRREFVLCHPNDHLN
jgi:aspartate ammonia-lyase